MRVTTPSLPKIVMPFAREYECFLVCADAGSLLKASERLGIQQAGLSKIIRKLETERGERLFYRDARGVKLNRRGEALYECLKRTKHFWHQAYGEVIEPSVGFCGKLTVGAHPAIAAECIDQILSVVARDFPRIQLEFELTGSLETTRLVAQHRIDLGLVINPIRNADLVAKDIREEGMALWSRSGKASTVLVYNPEMYSPQVLLGKHPERRVLAVRNYEVIANLARNSEVLGCLPNRLARRYDLRQWGEQVSTSRLKLIYHRERFAKEQLELVRRIHAALRE